MRPAARRCTVSIAAGLLALAPITTALSAAAAGRTGPMATTPRLAGDSGSSTPTARQLKRELGYLPSNYRTYFRIKARADQLAGVNAQPAAPALAGSEPVSGPGWTGVNSADTAPLDANGAVGPTRYLDIVNYSLGIYDRAGNSLGSGTLNTLTHDTNGLSDPVVLWDPATDRFYFQVLDVTSYDTLWGFSKTDSPSSFADFCTYDTDFGYGTAGELPDYPKLGQTADFLLIGVNVYGQVVADRTDVNWISKPQGTAPITTCPPASSFPHGQVTALKNADGSVAWTPVPAIQTDPSGTGYIVADYDVGGTTQGDVAGSLPTANFLTVFTVTKNPDGTPNIPTTGRSVTVGHYESPANAPQPGPAPIDTLDGRLTHAVSAVDPLHGGVDAVWTEHAVFGGAGSEVRWYEINPQSASLIQSGSITDPTVSVFNAAISPDRAVNGGAARFGGTMFTGFTTSSPSQAPAIEMVDKYGDQAQSPWVSLKQSPGGDDDFTCEHLYLGVPRPTCRWGDYSGATPDPTPAVQTDASIGSVWLTNEYVDGPPNGTINGTAEESWNWQALPATQPSSTVPEVPWLPLLPMVGLTGLTVGAVVRKRRAALRSPASV